MTKSNSQSLVSKGVDTCPGCGLELAIRKVLDVLGDNVVIIIPPGCAALFSGFGNRTALKVPGIQGNLANTAAYAAGVKSGFEIQGKIDIIVLAFAGDGATADIGIQALSGVFERGDNIIYVCYDNEAYMNTGIQRSGSTPFKAKTTTTPKGKLSNKKDMIKIAAAHNIPYIASASVGYLDDLKKKIEKAKNVNGPSYIHIHTPCPTGWFFDPSKTIEVAKVAIQTGLWPLCEIEDGKLRITKKIRQLKPIEEYFKLQGRFKHLSPEDIKKIQERMIKRIISIS
jgi:pyruvate/2-oxoacid:ferredoxin oxidoreductase beta subunit